MYDGYSRSVKDNDYLEQELDFRHFYYLSIAYKTNLANMGDLEDIIPAFSVFAEKDPNCNALIKFSREKGLIVGHNTFNIYSLMLRIYKVYDF